MKLTWRQVKAVCRFASDIAGKLPARGDGPLQVGVKLLAIADSAEKQWGRRTVSTLLDMHDVVERSSAAFVRLFWETDLHKAFEIRRLGGHPHYEIIEARAPNGERLFFQEYRYSFGPATRTGSTSRWRRRSTARRRRSSPRRRRASPGG